ncbi:IS66 family insertion sequence element accessory protein TnpA [Virgibacillus kimchii]
MTLKDKRIEWEARYDAWKDSGQSVAEWCRDHEIKAHQMYYWIQRFENQENLSEQEPTQWLAVQVEEENISSKGEGPIFIHFDALSVEVRPGANVGLLSDIIHVLRNQC